MKIHTSVSDASLEQFVSKPEKVTFGSVNLQEKIKTTIGPFQYLSAYSVTYPKIVIDALTDLYAEYNQAFSPLVEGNREWDEDYQYCMTGRDGSPINYFVQIDMVGLPEDYLQVVSNMNRDDVRENLREAVFEIENSVAIYQILSGIFSDTGRGSYFGTRFQNALDDLRQKRSMPIALVALTEQKYQAMREIEFGKQPGEELTDTEVRRLSGFDTFFGPDQLVEHITKNNGQSKYLLYVRASDPLSKLRNPNLEVKNEILADENLRRIIKAYSITMNIDNPEWPLESPARINDTKGYLPLMNMAYPVHSREDLESSDLQQFLQLRELGMSTDSDKVIVRAKPMTASYGCYGHERGTLASDFRRRMKININKRGPYIIQPERPTPTITNADDNAEYTYIDRNFFYTDGRSFEFLGGFRLLMLKSSEEAQRGKIHNTGSTVWAEICGE